MNKKHQLRLAQETGITAAQGVGFIKIKTKEESVSEHGKKIYE